MGIKSIKRRQQIKGLLAAQGEVSVDNLAKEFSTSKVTIRRDLMQLEREGCLLRTYGGAVKAGNNIPLHLFFEEKAKKNMREKQAIAREALTLIQRGDVIFLDSGTTTWELAKLLREDQERLRDVTIVTSSIPILWELAKFEGLNLIALGGRFRHQLLDLCGPQAEKEMVQYNIDEAFLGVDAISHEKGLSTTDFHTAYLEEEVIKSSKKVIVLADHSKIGRDSSISYGDLAQIDILITDDIASPEEVGLLRDLGVKVRVVNTKGGKGK